jgi:hypothetical protein
MGLISPRFTMCVAGQHDLLRLRGLGAGTAVKINGCGAGINQEQLVIFPGTILLRTAATRASALNGLGSSVQS